MGDESEVEASCGGLIVEVLGYLTKLSNAAAKASARNTEEGWVMEYGVVQRSSGRAR